MTCDAEISREASTEWGSVSCPLLLQNKQRGTDSVHAPWAHALLVDRVMLISEAQTTAESARLEMAGEGKGMQDPVVC